MKKRKNQWTPYEDSIVFNAVRKDAACIQEAFRTAKKKLPKRSIGAISARWYQTLSVQKKATAVSFIVLSKKKLLINRKICKPNAYMPKITVKKTHNLWDTLVNMFIKQVVKEK